MSKQHTNNAPQTKDAPATGHKGVEAQEPQFQSLSEKKAAAEKTEKAPAKKPADSLRFGRRKSGGEFLFENGKVYQIKRLLKHPDMSDAEFDTFIAS